MSSKEAFLKELQSGLAVLAESEQEDILAEYAQHIDLRMAGGLTEEEAIRDFGDIKQLTAEILSAYHVDPNFVRAGEKHHDFSVKQKMAPGGGLFQRLGRKLAGAFRRVAGALPALVRRLKQKAAAQAERRQARAQEKAQEQEVRIVEVVPVMAEKKRPSPGRGRRFFSGVGRFFRGLGRGLGWLVRLAAWLAWNALLLFCAIPVVLTALAALIIFGFMLVWAVQGLPLAGLAIGFLGLFLFCAGLLGLGSCLIWHRKRPVSAGAAPEEAAEEKEVFTDGE